MLSSARHYCVTGTAGTLPIDAGSPARGESGAFARLVSVYQSNEYLSAELKSADRNLARARAYLREPGANPALAAAHLQRVKARRSAALTLLRANRHRARILLGTGDTGADAEVA